MINSGKFIIEGQGGSALRAKWMLQGELLTLEMDAKVYEIASDSDLARAFERFLKSLERTLSRGPLLANCCLECEHFLMSSMARDMGRGQRGACMLHKCAVEICYVCPDFHRKG